MDGTIELTPDELIDQATGWILFATNDTTVAVCGNMDCSGNAALMMAEKLAESAEALLKQMEDQGATPK